MTRLLTEPRMDDAGMLTSDACVSEPIGDVCRQSKESASRNATRTDGA